MKSSGSLVFALLLLLAVPAAAGAATVGVEAYVEPPLPPGDDGFGSCGRYAQCPADMVVFSAAAGEANRVTITWESVGYRRQRIVVQEESYYPVVPPVFPPVQAGPGCERLDDRTAACVAEVIGPVYLGDGDDRIDSPAGDVHGGEGADILNVRISGSVKGEGGDDIMVGDQGDGGPGADLLAVTSGVGGAGDDILRCSPTQAWCYLDGGLGDDVLTGGTASDRLLGREGNDLMQGGANFDRLAGGLGNDRLVGGAGVDQLDGDSGADRLVSREDRPAGEARVKDRVDCGTGRRDRAVVDRADDVKRCERVAGRDRPRWTEPAAEQLGTKGSTRVGPLTVRFAAPCLAFESPLTTRSFGRFCSAFRIAACHFPGRSSNLSASSSASWNSRRWRSLISTSGG